VCDGLQNSVDLGETFPPVCCETLLTLSPDGSEVSNIRVEEVFKMQEEEDHMAVVLRAAKAADKLCYVCNIILLTVVQAYTVASAFWQCVVCCLDGEDGVNMLL
jgi:fatty acid desaturase